MLEKLDEPSQILLLLQIQYCHLTRYLLKIVIIKDFEKMGYITCTFQ